MLSGPPGVQNEQVSGTEASRKWRCFSPGLERHHEALQADFLLVERHHRGRVHRHDALVFPALVLRSVNTDQATTSVRACSGANGLSGLCTPAPCPCGSADGVPAGAEAAGTGEPSGDDS